jgi:hypothetical protein
MVDPDATPQTTMINRSDMTASLQAILDEYGIFEALNRLAASPDSIALSADEAEKRLMVAAQLLTMSAERSALLLQIVEAHEALSRSTGTLTACGCYEEILSIQHVDMPPPTHELKAYIEEFGIVSAIEKAIAAPSLFGVTNRDIADKLRLIRKMIVKPDIQ